METGIVKWFNDAKGFGFIVPEDGGKEIFAHYSQIVSGEGHKGLVGSQRVSYVTGQGAKGPHATQIRSL